MEGGVVASEVAEVVAEVPAGRVVGDSHPQLLVGAFVRRARRVVHVEAAFVEGHLGRPVVPGPVRQQRVAQEHNGDLRAVALDIVERNRASF